MAIVSVYKCPYYGKNIDCPHERNFIPCGMLVDKFYTYDPFFCDRDGVLIDNHKNAICRINIDTDVEHSLQNTIDYISKCKVRGEKGDLEKS